ncbi:hypothetical protein DMH01_15765 [Amycolatopsis sp. WAC 04182]|uniref:hypothetical protein n=1 Tax=Amycolatopsis sp. WAC 04182 TaxID=2203198 RepID=UPI000F7A998C|nr:hypothetical protein [Amycolatopsis sp. WAC 04182]RSN60732.1 hypothetical protein DMH01_15765 [Amycolatopsis sp. WAC 04182]
MLRRTIATVSVALATAFGLTVAADSAAAGTVTQTLRCLPGPSYRTVYVTVTAPDIVKKDVAAAVFVKMEHDEPWAGPGPGSPYTAGRLALGGADSDTVTVSLSSPTVLEPGDPWILEGTVKVTFIRTGTGTLTFTGHGIPPWFNCGQADPPVAETVTVNP